MTAFAYQIRSAAPCDAEAICAVHVASIRGLCASDYSAEQIDAWADAKKPDIYRRAMAEGERMFVAETQNAEEEMTVIGLAGIQGSEVRAVYVHPAYVGLGVGSTLLATIEAEARSHGVRSLTLYSTINARGFYLNHRYRDDGATRFTLLPGLELPCVKMSKDLTATGAGAGTFLGLGE